MLRHVHRELDELPHRGDGARAAGQRDHAGDARRAARLFERAGALVVSLAKRYYLEDDESVLPRSIATRDAFENAMALDIAMGGSTNTILHLLAAAHEAERGLRAQGDRRAVPAGAVPVQGRAERLLPRRGRAPGRRDLHDPRRARPGRAAEPGGAHRARRADLRLGPAVRVGAAGGRRAVPRGARRGADDQGVLAVGPVGVPGPRRGRRVHPRRRARVHRRRRPLHAVREPGDRGRGREDRRRARGAVDVLRSRPGVRVAGRRRGRDPRRAASPPATSSSSGTRGRAAGPGCRRCCTRRRS